MSKNLDMIPEEEACALLRLKPDTLRKYTRNEKRRKLDIRTSKPTRKAIFYNRRDIETIIKMKAS